MHWGAALLVGIGVGTVLGFVEGSYALVSGGLVGRYNNLVIWAILFDASALTALELASALVVELVLLPRRRLPSPISLVSLQLGVGVLGATVAWTAWSLDRANPSSLIANGLKPLEPAAMLGLLLGAIVALVTYGLVTRWRALRQLNARVWFAVEALVWLVALGFGLNLFSPAAKLDQPVLAAASTPQFNVLIVTIDTLRADMLGVDGNPTVQTPNLDRVAHSGTWFTNNIIQQPNTNASHTSIFTGVFPFVHGVRQHMIDTLSPDVPTLAEILGAHGYTTAGLYSWVSLEKGFSGLRGFQTYEDLSIHLTPLLENPRFQDLIVTYRLLGKYLFLPAVIEGQALQGEQDAVEDTTDGRANVTTDAAVRWLDANSSKRFFLWVHYYDPHYPYTPPPPFDTMYDPNYTGHVDGGMGTIHYIYKNNTGDLTDADVNHLKALYEGEISFTDQQFGRLMDELDRLGLSSDTLVVVTGDHGESLGTDGRWFHGSRLNYTDIHTPLIMRFPSVIPADRSIQTPVESVDIMPTILDLLKVPALQDVQGTSLMPLMSGAQPVSAQAAGEGEAVTMMDSYKQMSLVTSQWHLIWDQEKNTTWLYDYHADPLELQDLASQNPDATAQLLQQLQQRLDQLGFKNK